MDYVLKLCACKLTLLFLVRGEAFIAISTPFPVPLPVPLDSSVAMKFLAFFLTFGIEVMREEEKRAREFRRISSHGRRMLP